MSEWGHDFRPAYRKLSRWIERIPRVPRVALTATADPDTRREIVDCLRLRSARRFVTGFDRPNIRLRVDRKTNGMRQLLHFLERRPDDESGIVYRLTRTGVESTAVRLAAEGYDVLPYHAGLSAGRRRATEGRFLRGEARLVVATVAFGMGIDKPDVRFVYHVDPPRSLEAYIQETGRAGRDGRPARAVLTIGAADVRRLRRWVDGGRDPNRRRVGRRKLEALLEYCETTRCRRQVVREYFGEDRGEPCGDCDLCRPAGPLHRAATAIRRGAVAIGRRGERLRPSGLPGRSPPEPVFRESDRRLYEKLRAKRTELARAWGLAPFMVLSDHTLLEMALRRPGDPTEIERVHGVGRTKRERYGEELLGVIRKFER